MANLTKTEQKLLAKLLGKAEGKPTKTAKDTLNDLVSFMAKHNYKPVKDAQPNQYTTKQGTRDGFVVKFSNGKTYQVGQHRSWKLE